MASAKMFAKTRKFDGQTYRLARVANTIQMRDGIVQRKKNQGFKVRVVTSKTMKGNPVPNISERGKYGIYSCCLDKSKEKK